MHFVQVSGQTEPCLRGKRSFEALILFFEICEILQNKMSTALFSQTPEALLKGIEALREKFPRSGTRELFFGLLRAGALSSTRVALSLYDFAARLQGQLQEAQSESTDNILNELWSLDEGRCTVSGRRFSEGKRQSWVNSRADVLVDKQVAALRSTVAPIAPRPLFA